MPATSLRSTTRPIVQAVCSIRRQVSESSRGGVGVVTLRSSPMSAGRCAKRQVSRACTGQVLKSIVKSMCACALASAQSSVALSRLNSSEPSTMTRADLSCGFRAMPRAWVSRARRASTLLHHLLELQHLVRLAHPAGGEAGELLADHADLARLLDLVAQGAQAGAVDLAGGGEDVDALERRRQRRGDLGADLGDELMPSLVVRQRARGRSGGFARQRSAGLRASKADRQGSWGRALRPGRDVSSRTRRRARRWRAGPFPSGRVSPRSVGPRPPGARP